MTGAERAAQRVYQELLARVGEARPRPRLEPVRRLTELVGSPQLSFPVVQVAGTNGKSSTSRAIESLLRAHGLRTGLFTSPHLTDFSERFALDGTAVSGHVLAEAWEELRLPLQLLDAQLAEEGAGSVTFFEAIVVLAFAVFADAPVDVVVLEVGMGGQWDATNVADAKVAVFTPIDLDHTSVLGADRAEIARTKAGIVKAGCTVVSARQSPEALTEIVSACEREDARLFIAGRDFSLNEDRLAVGGRQISLRGLHGHDYAEMFVPLHGAHQAQNVSLAVCAVEAFFGSERPLPAEVCEEGLAQLTVPGRLQLIGQQPPVYVDAAHNPHGAEALARAATESFAFTEIALVAGGLQDKDVEGMLRALEPVATVMFLAPCATARSLAVADLEQVRRSLTAEGLADDAAQISVHDSLAEAIDSARLWATQAEGRAVLVTGSVLLAGEAMSLARREGWAL